MKIGFHRGLLTVSLNLAETLRKFGLWFGKLHPTLLRLFRCYQNKFTVILSTRLPSTWALQPTCLCACLVHWSHPPTRSIYTATDHLIYTQNTQHLRGITIYTTNMDYLLCCKIWSAVFFSVYINYMLNTRVSQWCKQINSRKTLVCLLVQNYWEKQTSLQNLEPYVVLVSYSL